VKHQRLTPYDKSASFPTLRPIAGTSVDTHRSSALLDHLARLTRVRSESALAPLGLRPRHLVALTVLREQGVGTQQALAAALHVDRTNLVGLLNDLERTGLIARRRDVDDRRRHIVELTDDGATRLREAECALAAAENEVLGALDPEQREQLYRLLQQATAGHTLDCAGAVAAAEAEPTD
jgi:DNA-binding MarR family transcriptional regulator